MPQLARKSGSRSWINGRHLPDEDHDIITGAASVVEEFKSLDKNLAIFLFIENIPEVILRSICLKMDIFDVLSVRFMKRDRSSLYEFVFTILTVLITSETSTHGVKQLTSQGYDRMSCIDP